MSVQDYNTNLRVRANLQRKHASKCKTTTRTCEYVQNYNANLRVRAKLRCEFRQELGSHPV